MAKAAPAAAPKSKKPKYEDDDQRKERHMAAIDDALRAAPSNLNPRDRLALERRAVDASGTDHKQLDEAE